MKSFLFILFLILQPPTVELIEKSKYKAFVDKGYTIIDVRTPEEYLQGHIQGAQNIDVRAETFITEIQKLSKSDTLLVYCRSGRRSLYAAQVLVSFGFKKIYDLEGGFLNW
jgi:rhodanese-related sulfurtransferase